MLNETLTAYSNNSEPKRKHNTQYYYNKAEISNKVIILWKFGGFILQESKIPVKKNAATILREAARIIKEEEKDIQK